MSNSRCPVCSRLSALCVSGPAPTWSEWQIRCSQQFAASWSLFALFFALPSFVFDSLQTLFAKYRGVGTLRWPGPGRHGGGKGIGACFRKRALQKQSQKQDVAFGLGALFLCQDKLKRRPYKGRRAVAGERK